METWHISNVNPWTMRILWSSAPLFPIHPIAPKSFLTIPKFPTYPLGLSPLPSTTGINEGLLRDSPNPRKGSAKKILSGRGAALSSTYPNLPLSQSSKSSDLFQSWFRTKNEAITRRKGEVACTVNVNIWKELPHSIHVWYMVYLPTFTIESNQMKEQIPYMDGRGNGMLN